MNKLYCRNCGKEIPDKSEYCPFCGARLDSGSEIMLASWGERFIAWLIDMFVLGIVLSWLIWPGVQWFPKSWGAPLPSWLPFADFGIKNVIHFLYWTFLESYYGQSLGKMVMKIEVTTLRGHPIDMGKSAIQSIGKAFLLPLDCIVGWIMYPSRQQRLFNQISGTIVIKKRVV